PTTTPTPGTRAGTPLVGTRPSGGLRRGTYPEQRASVGTALGGTGRLRAGARHRVRPARPMAVAPTRRAPRRQRGCPAGRDLPGRRLAGVLHRTGHRGR